MITDKHIELCERFAELLMRNVKRQSEEIDTLVNEYPDLPVLNRAETIELLRKLLVSNFVTSLAIECGIPEEEMNKCVRAMHDFFEMAYGQGKWNWWRS